LKKEGKKRGGMLTAKWNKQGCQPPPGKEKNNAMLSKGKAHKKGE